jgi:phage shock protein PspC (stress-responsive transcriptional regulator)
MLIVRHHRRGVPPRATKDRIMHTPRQNLFTRDDTFFGVCEGLGEDLRIPPNLLRLGFTLTLFFYPLVSLAAYAGAGLVVLLTRLLVPNPRLPKAQAAPDAVAIAAAQAPEQQGPETQAAEADEPQPMPLAA